MARTRRGGAFEGLKKLFGIKSKEEKCADAQTKAKEACASESLAANTKSVADAGAEMAGAPAAPAAPAAPSGQTAGRSRRRRHVTRRKYKSGKHRRSH